jgi:hypothetical protein
VNQAGGVPGVTSGSLANLLIYLAICIDSMIHDE